MTKALPVKDVRIDRLTPHPRNYKQHPDRQLEHIRESLRLHGFYRNVVCARDLTILAGHGVVLAATAEGWDTVPVIQLDLDPMEPKALHVLASDNETPALAERDDRAMTEILRDILHSDDVSLLGTGFDEATLAALTYVSRPASEIAELSHAAEWVGLPEFEAAEAPIKLVMSFRTEQDRETFVEQAGVTLTKKESRTWMAWWPHRERQDLASLRFEVDA